MPTYYAELTGGTIKARETFSGGTIYSTGGATVIQNIKSASATPSSSSQHISITPDVGYDAMGEVQLTVDAIPPEYIIPTGTKTITTNGTHDVKAYQNAYVNVQGGGGATLETKSVSYTPSESAISDTLLPDVGYDGFSEVDVSVGAIPSNYVGSSVPRKSSSDLTASGATVTAPAGYYSENATKTIPNAPSPRLTDVDIESNGTATATMEVDDGGYIQGQTFSLSLANAVPVQAAQTITPGTTDQTITRGKWLGGDQTILGDADLVASNIKKDVTIFGVTGTYEGGGGGNDILDYTLPSGAYTSSGTTAKVGAFYGRTGITSLNLPSLTSAMDYAFAYMTNLTSVSMPNLASVGIRAFDHSANITSISLPMLTTSGTHTFADCTNLETIDCPLLTSVPANFLAECKKYKNVVLPSVTTLGASAFDFGNSQDHGYLVLGKRGTTSTLSTLQAIGWNLTRQSIFTVVDCAMPLNMNGNSQGSVTTLILRSTTMSTLSNVNYRLGGVTDIYVPSALLSSYQSASNWSTLYSGGTITLTAIEGSYYETHYADGTTIS